MFGGWNVAAICAQQCHANSRETNQDLHKDFFHGQYSDIEHKINNI